MFNLQSGNHPCSLRYGGMCKTRKLLVVAPHPDDFDAMGVTLKFLSDNGNYLHVIVACTGSGVEDSYCPGATLADKAQLREKEQRNSARFFGLPENSLTFLHLENDAEDKALDITENLDKSEKLILLQNPDIIFLLHGNDTNSAHRVIYCLGRQIALRSRLSLALLLIRDPKTISMRPDLYFPFGEAAAGWKAELLRCHGSQQQRNLNTRGYGFDERILKLNRQIARELSLDEPYAESFELEVFH